MSRSWPGRSRRRPVFRRPRSLARRVFDYFLTIAILGLLIVLAARLDRVETRLAAGSAVVNDGDSLTIGVEKIRLRGIDAPEYTQICKRAGVDYACGRKSREALALLIGKRAVSCKGWERDRYGRLLGSCSVDGVSLNRTQVEAGWAVAYGDYAAEEQAARKKSIGLWAGTFDDPRQWRDAHGGMSESSHDYPGSISNWFREIFRFS